MTRIRAHADLTTSRDTLTREWRALCDALDACGTVRDLDAVLRTLRAMRVDEALGDLIVAVDAAGGPAPRRSRWTEPAEAEG